MNLREAAQQALEAYDAHEPMAVVMEALRAALAEPQEKYTWGTPLLDAFLLAPKPGQLKDRGQE